MRYNEKRRYKKVLTYRDASPALEIVLEIFRLENRRNLSLPL